LKLRSFGRRSLLAGAVLFLIWLAWKALSGGLRQLPRSRTAGQKVETLVQFECGFLSLLVIVTTFRWRHCARPVQAAWEISLAAAAGLSALVWGPPMPLVGVLFAGIGLFVARAVRLILRKFHPL
jgi:hypothetical protein